MESSAVNNAQYHRREPLEMNPVPTSINDEFLESNICKALSLTGHEVKPDYPQASRRLKEKDTVFSKFKYRKQRFSILINRKNLCNKSDVLTHLSFPGRLLVSDSIYHENYQLVYKCRESKNAGKIHFTWFWNNSVNIKLDERSQPGKIHHTIGIEKLLDVDSLD